MSADAVSRRLFSLHSLMPTFMQPDDSITVYVKGIRWSNHINRKIALYNDGKGTFFEMYEFLHWELKRQDGRVIGGTYVLAGMKDSVYDLTATIRKK